MLLFLNQPTNAKQLKVPPPPPPAEDILDLFGRNLVKSITNNSAITVCIADLRPMVYCDETVEDTSTYSGFDVEMFRQMASDLKLTEGTDYVFKCVEFDVMLDNATDPSLPRNEVCDISAGGITITAQRQEEGVKFSYPYLNTGLQIAVRFSQTTVNGWRWTQPFTLNLWLVVLATLVIFPIILFLLEFGSLKPRIERAEFLPGYEEATVR